MGIARRLPARRRRCSEPAHGSEQARGVGRSGCSYDCEGIWELGSEREHVEIWSGFGVASQGLDLEELLVSRVGCFDFFPLFSFRLKMGFWVGFVWLNSFFIFHFTYLYVNRTKTITECL